MAKALFSPRAVRDFNAIARYITRESGSLKVAQQFVSKLRAKCHHLATLPRFVGVRREELGEGLRSQPFQNYVIFFRYRQDVLEIVTIMEGHRDVAGLFEPPAAPLPPEKTS